MFSVSCRTPYSPAQCDKDAPQSGEDYSRVCQSRGSRWEDVGGFLMRLWEKRMWKEVWKTAVLKWDVSFPHFYNIKGGPSTTLPWLQAPVWCCLNSIISPHCFGGGVFSCLSSCTTGEVPFNHEILREANALCHRLPVLSTTKFKTDFYDVSKLCLSFKHLAQDVFIRCKLKATVSITLYFSSQESFGGVKTNKSLVCLALSCL